MDEQQLATGGREEQSNLSGAMAQLPADFDLNLVINIDDSSSETDYAFTQEEEMQLLGDDLVDNANNDGQESAMANSESSQSKNAASDHVSATDSHEMDSTTIYGPMNNSDQALAKQAHSQSVVVPAASPDLSMLLPESSAVKRHANEAQSSSRRLAKSSSSRAPKSPDLPKTTKAPKKNKDKKSRR